MLREGWVPGDVGEGVEADIVCGMVVSSMGGGVGGREEFGILWKVGGVSGFGAGVWGVSSWGAEMRTE